MPTETSTEMPTEVLGEASMDHLERVAGIAGVRLPDEIRQESHHVVLNGRRFHYLTWGAADGYPLLFLHGGNQSAHTWDVVCAALSDRYYCVALDQRGHGESEWSYEGDYAPASQAGDVAALVRHLGWRRFVLTGMSMGCLNALHYAVRDDTRAQGLLAGLVAVDAGPFLDERGGRGIIDFVGENLEHESFDDYVRAALRFNPRRREELLRHSLRHTVRQKADGRWTWKADRRQPMTPDVARAWLAPLPSLIGRIDCPVLVMRGEQSPVLSEDNARRFATALARGRWVTIPGAGHTVQGDNPAAMLAEMNAFLDGLGLGVSSSR